MCPLPYLGSFFDPRREIDPGDLTQGKGLYELPDVVSWRLRRAYALAEAMESKDLSLDKLAEVSELCPGHLSRNFIRLAGCTFLEFRLRKRLKEGKRLLVETSLSVKQIADRLGCCGPSFFSQSFKRTTGYSPTAYRKYYWANGAPAITGGSVVRHEQLL